MSIAATPPEVIVFDVNETLLDLESMRAGIGEALGGREDLLPLWFSTMLHHSLVTTATGDYRDFGEIGVAALLMVAEINKIPLAQAQAKAAIMNNLLNLPAHQDVKAGLQVLRDKGYKLVSFTNSSNNGVKTQFKNAGLIDYFDARYSVEDAKVYKPDLRAYQWLFKQLSIQPERALMVAAHGWDVAGAKAAGMQTAFIKRPGKVLYPLAQTPDYQVNDLLELANKLPAVN
ncbi:haloacid dehalogenase type II [Gayadomonas joobiniege]|uniref:haloacid dehalogenase type II n=1 Tax=Gayadomonas joobiniege TaxID=1234606 RepID=UPI000368C6D3|nr:haloacid dehalogenase type II [Gayadomonas joobiniege]